MRIAVVGAGISGCLAARLLSAEHQVTLFDENSHLGGHAQTVEVPWRGGSLSVDVGFMVFNRRTYPQFDRMLDLLGVASQPSDMSFSVSCQQTGLEYQGSSLDGLFAQRRNLLRPKFHRLLVAILRFNRVATEYIHSGATDLLLGDFLDKHRFASDFRDRYLVPMSAAIWSADPATLVQFPARFILGFCHNHGLLQLRDRPQWRTIVGGSRSYVQRLVGPLEHRLRPSMPVTGVRRTEDGVLVEFQQGSPMRYDHVILATHADQSLRLLRDATAQERRVLSCIPYQQNDAVLHSDISAMPNQKRAWASWNYRIGREAGSRACVTYDLNRLQRLGTSGPVCLTLNPTEPLAADRVVRKFQFTHPVFSSEAVEAQASHSSISGVGRTHFCGAYWGYGFHEDGVNSALAVAKTFGLALDDLVRPPTHHFAVSSTATNLSMEAR